jgi:peptidoglycan/LPS O-acetylase OafA/YrhL
MEATPQPETTHAPRLYRPELDALRFFAFLAVLTLHSVGFSQAGVLRGRPLLLILVATAEEMGKFGLSLFFLLSSFLITSLLLVEQQKTGTVHLGSFYTRRILRIWPLYFTFMLGAFLLGEFWAPVAFSWKALLAFCLLSGNWYVMRAGMISASIIALWSISVEEQFYLIWPSIVRNMTRSHMRAFCICLAGASLMACYILPATGSDGSQLWNNTLSQAIFFAAGALLAFAFGLKEQRKSLWKSVLGLISALACWATGAHLGFMNPHAPPYIWPFVYALGAFGCSSMLWAFLHLPRRLIRPELVYLGRISYGLYVFHGVYLALGRHLLRDSGLHLRHLWLPITFLFIVGTASLSYAFLEKPFLRLKHRFEFVHSRAA